VDQLAAIRTFIRIVETGSFTQAAQSLEMPKPTATRLIQLLETHLRTKLLNRSTRRLAVTADGAAYYERAVRLLADLEELDGAVTASQVTPKGRLRIDVSPSLAQYVLIPAMVGFFERYPDIQLDIGASDRQTDLIAENVDCVIRAGVIADQSLIARRIASLHMVTCAAPAYLRRYGMPLHPTDLERDHRVVGYFSAGTGRPRPFHFHRGTERLEVEGRYQAATNDVMTYLAAALAGHGVVQMTLGMVRSCFAEGTLVPVLEDWEAPSLPLHIVYPPNRHLSAKLRVFVDWAASLFASPDFTPAKREAGEGATAGPQAG
jgi:LysR family transcriptional regulator for bpeEF and oprC